MAEKRPNMADEEMAARWEYDGGEDRSSPDTDVKRVIATALWNSEFDYTPEQGREASRREHESDGWVDDFQEAMLNQARVALAALREAGYRLAKPGDEDEPERLHREVIELRDKLDSTRRFALAEKERNPKPGDVVLDADEAFLVARAAFNFNSRISPDHVGEDNGYADLLAKLAPQEGSDG